MKVKILAAIIAVAALAFGAGSASASAPIASTYVPVTPSRVWDTRLPGNGGMTGDDSITLGIPVPVGATAVVLNITATNPTSASYLTVFPADAPRPGVSNLNFVAGQTVANLAIVKLSADGRIKIYNNTGAVDVVVDLEGYYIPAA